MQGTEIYLAGAEVETLMRALVDNEVPYILFSFYYIHAFGQAGMIERMQREHPHIRWFLDSGAFTYSVQLGKGKPLPDPKKYIALYTQFVERFGERWCRIAEPDLDGIDGLDVTIEEVDAWRNAMLDKHPHLPIMPCWHGWRGWDDWAAYCADDRIKHLSFGRMSGNDANLRKLTLYAHEHGKTVHGFGFTKMNTSLVRGVVVPCDSVDSSVAGSSLVWLRSANRKAVRVLPIADAYRGWEEGKYRGWETLTSARGPAWYETVWSPLAGVVRHTKRTTLGVVTLESGRSIRLTPNHSVFRMSSGGTMELVEASTLKVGDYLTTVRAPVWGGTGVRSKVVRLGHRAGTQKRGRENSTLVEFDEDFLTFCGLWLADGSYSKHSINIDAMNDEECRDLTQRIADRWGRKLTLARDGVHGAINSTEMKLTMQALGLVGYSHTKRLPEWFWSLSREQAGWFLRGYFSGDGCGVETPYVTTVSRVLWRQLAEAIPAILGELVSQQWDSNSHRSSFGGPCMPSGRVTVAGVRARRAFLARIGFLQRRKCAAVNLEQEDRGRYTDGVPVDYAARAVRRYDAQWNPIARAERVRRDTDPSAFASHVLSPDVVYLRVRSVVWSEQELRHVYDLSVPGSEKFLADGVLAKNTSWVMGQKYGTLYIFRKDRLIVLRADQKRQRRRYASYLREIGCDPDKVCADDVREVRKANILAWRNLAVRFATLKADRERAEAAGHTGAGAYRSTDPRGPATNRGILREFSTPPRADRNPGGRRPEREPVRPLQPERTPAAEAKPTREPTYRPRVLGAFGAPIKDPNADPFE